jgi:hypothetical protein
MVKLDFLKFRVFGNKRIVKFFIAIVLIALCFSVMPVFLDLVVEVGNHVAPYSGENLVIDYFLGVLWAMILGVSILFWPVSSKNRRALLWIWLIKVFVALVLMLAYEYHYGLDKDCYFANSIDPDFVWDGFNFGDGTRLITQLVWFHNKFLFNSYYAAKISFALIGLIGSYLFYRAGLLFLQRQNIRVLYVFALFPSILFWSSILGKDPIVFFGVSLYVYGVVAWHRLRQMRYFIMFAFGIFIATLIRLWLAPIFIVPLLILVSIERYSFVRRTLFIGLCILALSIVLPRTQSILRILATEDLFQFRSVAVMAFAGGGSSLKPPEITVFSDLIRHLPFGIFTALFRPLPGEVLNLFGLLQGLENIVLLFLLFMAVKRTRLKELKDHLVIWAILLILLWASVYGIVVYNLGTLARYKLQILPVLIGLLLYFSRRRVREISQN